MKILITGASRGIGAALSRELAKGKHRLILLARDSESLKQLAMECNDIAKEEIAEYIAFDLMQLEECRDELMLRLGKMISSLDVLINNAGLLENCAFQESTLSSSRRQFEINYFVPELLTRLCLPFLKRSSSASVINVSSMGGLQGSVKFPGLAAYSASKGAIAILTECLAEELKDEEIRVNALAFGAVQTDMFESAFPSYRASANPQEIGSFFCWFVEEGWKRFNGKVLPVSESTP